MTLAPRVPPIPCATLEEAVALLRGRGLRMSTSRRLILEQLFAAEHPVCAEDIAGERNLDLASVYRNLEVLEQHGLIRHVHLGHGPGLYALIARGEREYLHCEGCDAVIAVAPSELDPIREEIRRRFGYSAYFTHFPITGICPACARAQAKPGA